MKRLIPILLALVLILSLATPAFAVNIEIKAPEGVGNLSNLTYTAYKVLSATVNDAGTGYSYTYEVGGPFSDVLTTGAFYGDYVPGTDETQMQITGIASGVTGSALANLFKGSTKKGTGLTATYVDGKFVIEDVEPGYYYIESSFGTGLIVDTVGKETLTVDPKNELPSLTKKIVSGDDRLDSITADRGETITFELTITIPNTATGDLVVHDKMEGLNGIMLKTFSPFENYNNPTDGCSVEFLLRNAENYAGEDLTITYTANVPSDAEISTVLTNSAWLTYSNFTSTPDDVTVSTGAVNIWKYVLKSGASVPETIDPNNPGSDVSALAGAGFVLKNAEGKYYKNMYGLVSWVDSLSEDCVVYSGEDGFAKFEGLAAGTYTVVEHVTPAGYNKADDIEVIVGTDENGIAQTITQTVENKTGTELPETGGMGTTLFYVFGGIMMLAAVVLLVTKKRMANT